MTDEDIIAAVSGTEVAPATDEELDYLALNTDEDNSLYNPDYCDFN